MRDNYAECERRVLLSEGGYTNDPRDPGGPTNWGITIGDARAYWKKDATAEDVRAMPRWVAEGIYRSKYWNALACDDLPSGVDYTVFDYGVNSGVARAARVLREQRALHKDPIALIDAINAERMTFLHSLKTWPHFGRGWGSRVVSVKAFSEHLAMLAKNKTVQAAPAPHYTMEPSAKAFEPAPTPAATKQSIWGKFKKTLEKELT